MNKKQNRLRKNFIAKKHTAQVIEKTIILKSLQHSFYQTNIRRLVLFLKKKQLKKKIQKKTQTICFSLGVYKTKLKMFGLSRFSLLKKMQRNLIPNITIHK